MQQPQVCIFCGRSGLAGYSSNHGLSPHACSECVDRHNQKMLENEWFKDEHELKLVILQVLFRARNRGNGRGCSFALVSDCVRLEGIFDIRPALSWLRRNKDVEVEQGKFFITEQGAAYLLEQIPALQKPFDEE